MMKKVAWVIAIFDHIRSLTPRVPMSVYVVSFVFSSSFQPAILIGLMATGSDLVVVASLVLIH